MSWETISLLIGGLGLGSIIATLMQTFLSVRDGKKKRLYEEKKEAYIGLLNALRSCAAEPSDRHAKDFALWQMRCELVGTEKVTIAIQGLIATEPGSRERNDFFDKLKISMREDILRSIC